MPSSACMISIDATSFHFRHCNCFVELGVINQLLLNQNHHCALNFARLLYGISPQTTSPTNDYLQGGQLNWIWGHQGLNCCDQTCTVIELEWLFESVNDNCGCLAETASEISELQPSSDQKDWTKQSAANCTGKCRFWRDVAIWQNIMLKEINLAFCASEHLQLSNYTYLSRQPIAVSDISIYCLIDIRYRYLIQKQIQRRTEWEASSNV